MKQTIVLSLLSIALFYAPQSSWAQACGSRQLDPSVAAFLKTIGYEDLTIEQLRSMPIEQIKSTAAPPLIPFPKEDVRRIKITEDSIPLLIFNPAHAHNLPVIINYHGGGFISPLLPGLEYFLWQEAKIFEAIVFAVDYRVAPENKFPAAVNDSYNAFNPDFSVEKSRFAATWNC